MYIIQNTLQLNGKLIPIYYTEKPNKLGTPWWSQDERDAKQFETEQQAETITNIGKPTIKEKL